MAAHTRLLPQLRVVRGRAAGLAITVWFGARSRVVEVDDEQYAALDAAARAGETGSTLLKRVRSLKLEATAKRLKYFQEQARRIAERLNKGHILVEIEHHGVRLGHRRWAPFWSAFVHAVRNALDRGIEPLPDRVAAGKTEPGTVTLRTFEEQDRLVVEIADNGRGVDWQLVAKRAEGAGLPAATALDLERTLFVDGISTAASITDASGRGVGMGALLVATQSLGGNLSIESTLNVGMTLRFSFPPSSVRASTRSLRW
jgi:chemotaxis protein histidine kinase CheA